MRVARLILALTHVLFSAAVFASPYCGLGAPPGSPEFLAEQIAKEAQLKMQGYLLVCDADLDRFDLALNPADIAELSLAFTPVELKATPFERLQYLGAHVDAMNDIRSTLYREFQLQKGVRATLKEHDMSADGTTEMEGLNQALHLVNGQPARYVKLRSPAGKEVDVLAWTEGRRAYQLSIKANAASENSAGKIFDLARSLPRSVPACPDSATPATVRLGKNGLPEFDWGPDSRSAEDMNAAYDRSRPCKSTK